MIEHEGKNCSDRDELPASGGGNAGTAALEFGHMLQLTQHVVKMRLHAGDLKGLAVELVVQFQQAGLPVRLGQVGFQ